MALPRDFKLLMSSRFLFTLAVQMQAVVLGWRMYELTKDPLYLGLIGLVEALPALSLALLAGYIVDRSRPLIVYRWAMLGSFFSGLLMLVTQHPALGFSIPQQASLLFVSSFLTGTVRGFTPPAIFALVPRIVPRNQLRQSSAVMATAMQVGRIAGPALGGLIFGFFGFTVVSLVICGSLLLGQVTLSLIQTSPQPSMVIDEKHSIKAELLSGMQYVFKHPILFPALSLDMISVLFGGVTALLPIFASEILNVGAQGLGWLRAAPAVGAALMSFALIKWEIKRNAGPLLFTAVTGFGFSILIFALSQSLWLSLISLFFSGVFDSVSMVIRSTAVQLASPEKMRGRISSVNSIFIGSSNEIGEFESGVVAKLIGTQPAAIFGGIMCLLTVGLVAFLSPVLRRMDLEELEKQPQL